MNSFKAIHRPGNLNDGTFMNPIIKGNYADPSIIRVGSDYYMVHTSYKYLPGLIVWHSTDLIHWEPIGSAMNLPHFNLRYRKLKWGLLTINIFIYLRRCGFSTSTPHTRYGGSMNRSK